MLPVCLIAFWTSYSIEWRTCVFPRSYSHRRDFLCHFCHIFSQTKKKPNCSEHKRRNTKTIVRIFFMTDSTHFYGSAVPLTLSIWLLFRLLSKYHCELESQWLTFACKSRAMKFAMVWKYLRFTSDGFFITSAWNWTRKQTLRYWLHRIRSANEKERNCERKPFVNFCFVILILILLKRFFSSFHYLIGVCARDINPDRSITLKMINVFTLGKWNFDAMIYPKTCSLWPKITAVVFLCMLINVHTRDTIFNAIVSNVR